MRNLTPAQVTSTSSELVTICTLVSITLTDGTLVKVTDHDVDIAGYQCDFGLECSAVLMQLGGSGQTASITLLPDRSNSGGISLQQLENGLADGARVAVYWLDYAVQAGEPLLITTGYVTDAKYGNSAILELTINTKLSLATGLCSDNMSQTCRADFGDADCGVDITSLVDGPHVFAGIDSQSFILTRDEQTPPGFYNNGTVYFTSGQNKGAGYEILTVSLPDAFGRETLFAKVPFAHQVNGGDAVLLYPGCDKVLASGCTYWKNTARFQGEPFLAVQDSILPAVTANTGQTSGIDTGLPAIVNWWITQYIQIGFGKTYLFSPGDRAASGSKTIKTGGGSTVFFDDYMIPQPAYQSIYKLVGGTDNVAAFDGGLTPKHPDKVAALVAAGYQMPLNLNLSYILVNDPTLDVSVALAYALAIFVPGSSAYNAALTALGFPNGLPPSQGYVIGGSL